MILEGRVQGGAERVQGGAAWGSGEALTVIRPHQTA